MPAAVLVLAFGLLVLRRPAVLGNPEFWTEDGWLWWPDAYSQGLHSLAVPVAGYFQTVSRLAGLAVQPFGLAEAPLLFALLALLLQALPAAFLVSTRMAPVWPSLASRVGFAALYLALPNALEEHANLTNAQLHLALLAFLVLVAAPAQRRAGMAFDAGVLLLSGLSGPFCLLLVPVAAWRLAARQDAATAWRLALMLMTGLVQAASLLASRGTARSPGPLGAGLVTGAKVVAAQVLVAPVLGERLAGMLQFHWLWRDGVAPLLACLGALAAAALVLRRAAAWRVLAPFGLFAGLVLAAALAQPMISIEPQRVTLALIGAGQRYWMLPMLGWLGVLALLAADPVLLLRLAGRAALLAACVTAVLSFRYPDLPPTGFSEAAARFAAASPGQTISIPVEPPGSVPARVTRR